MGAPVLPEETYDVLVSVLEREAERAEIVAVLQSLEAQKAAAP